MSCCEWWLALVFVCQTFSKAKLYFIFNLTNWYMVLLILWSLIISTQLQWLISIIKLLQLRIQNKNCAQMYWKSLTSSFSACLLSRWHWSIKYMHFYSTYCWCQYIRVHRNTPRSVNASSVLTLLFIENVYILIAELWFVYFHVKT